MKKVIVCSKNKAKNDAVYNVMVDFFDDFNIISLETESGIFETPIGDEEGILGCKNRIMSALKQDGSGNLYVAMEGILTECSFGIFLCGWTVIYDKDLDKYYYGCSAKVKVHDEIIKNVDKNKRLSDVVAKYYHSTDKEVSIFGTNGILTNGCYTRTREFTDSILCAISSGYELLKDKI